MGLHHRSQGFGLRQAWSDRPLRQAAPKPPLMGRGAECTRAHGLGLGKAVVINLRGALALSAWLRFRVLARFV